MLVLAEVYPSIVLLATLLAHPAESTTVFKFNEGQRTMAVHRDLFKFPFAIPFSLFLLRFVPFVNIIGHYVFTPQTISQRFNVRFHTYFTSLDFFRSPLYLH